MQDKIDKELKAGRVMGPFSYLPYENLHISPLGLVPKKSEGSWRLIHHLSFPNKKEGSINAGISDDSAAVQYAGINEAISCIKNIGKNAFLCKTDIRSAFRILPVHPLDYELLGFQWNDRYYYDRCLPMGCRTSCKIFEKFSSALEWIAINKLGIKAVVHILDDFLLIETSQSAALSKLKSFVNLCEKLGVPLSYEKTEMPSQVMEFVGITIDVQRQEIRLPGDKLRKCSELLDKFIQMDICTLKEMQSLVGVLNFACSVVQPGRAFLRRMINLTMNVSETQRFLHLTEEVKEDMRIWQKFLNEYNGISMFLNENFLSSNILELHTDAAQSLGYGGLYNTRWFFGSFPDSWKDLNIMTLEFYPIIIALELWGSLWSNHSILFFTDNEALVSVINKQTSRDNQVMKMVRHMVLCCLKFNILFKSKHIPGKRNVLADCLSRLQVQHFKKLAPQVNKLPTTVPTKFLPENFWNTLQC